MNVSTGRIGEFLGAVGKKGVRLWSENGQLRYKAPKDVLTPQEIERLRNAKHEIVALFESGVNHAPGISQGSSRARIECIQLSFAQLAHWNLYRLDSRSSLSIVFGTLRIEGRLHVAALRRSLAEVIRRHDSLRTRIVIHDGVPAQLVTTEFRCELPELDLGELPADSRVSAAKELVEGMTLTPIMVPFNDSLFRTYLVRLSETDHLLVLAMEHIISDWSSMNVLRGEIFTAYTQIIRGRTPSLPLIPEQFSDYAAGQKQGFPTWLTKHGAHWKAYLNRFERLSFSISRFPVENPLPGWGFTRFIIDGDLTNALREWCRTRKTTLTMCVFTAYVALVLRWCGVREAMVPFETHGRHNTRLTNIIGYLASALYVYAELKEEDCFPNLLDRITREYVQAYEHADASYLESLVPRPGFTGNGLFNWAYHDPALEAPVLAGSTDALTITPFQIELDGAAEFERDTEPVAVFIESENGIQCKLGYSRSQLSRDAMDAFARNLLHFLLTLVTRPEMRIEDIDLL